MRPMPRFSSLFLYQRLNAIALPMLAGVALFLLLEDLFAVALLLCWSGALLLLIFRREGEEKKTLLCMLVGISFSLLVMGAHGIEVQRARGYCHTPRTAEGYVVAKGDASFDLALTRLDGKGFRKTVRVFEATDWSVGEKRSVKLILDSPDPVDDREDGIDFLAKCPSDSGKVVGKSYLYTFVGNVRKTLSERFSSRENGGFLAAVLLGDRSGLTEEQNRAFRRTASSHILAISGLHVSQAVAFFVGFLNLFPVPKKVIRVLLYPTVLAFYLLAGAGISVFRASVMTLLTLTGLLLRRRADSVTALSFSAALMVFGSPHALESPSFLLSYGSTFGIVACGVPICEYLRRVIREKENVILSKTQGILFALIMASVSFVFTMPIQLMLFDTATPFAPLYALILMPLFHACLILTLTGSLLTAFSFLPAAVPNFLLEISSRFPDFVEFLAKGAPAPVESTGVTPVLAVFFATAIAVLFWKKAPLWGVLVLHCISLLLLGVLSLVFQTVS